MNDAIWKQHLGQWGAYAAATGAALAFATNADAEIVYSGPINKIVNASHTSANFSIAHGNRVDLHFVASKNAIEVQGAHTHFFAASDPGKKSVAAFFGPGKFISGTHTSSGKGADLRRAYGPASHASRVSGHWGPGTVTGFLGCSTSPGGRGCFVQVKVENNAAGFPVEGEILEFAYNSVQFQGITTPTTPTPEPGAAALGLLASGAAGLLAWRRRRAA